MSLFEDLGLYVLVDKTINSRSTRKMGRQLVTSSFYTNILRLDSVKSLSYQEYFNPNWLPPSDLNVLLTRSNFLQFLKFAKHMIPVLIV